MSANQYRRQLDTKRSQRVEAGKKAAAHHSKESTKRAEAARARQASANSKTASTTRAKLREAERKEREAATAGKEAARWQVRASSYAKEEAALAAKLDRTEQSERNAVERASLRVQQLEERRIRAEHEALDWRIAHVEAAVQQGRSLPSPKVERLRVLILGASSEGDLRVGREQKRIRAAVESARHRDQIELDVRPAATTADLLDGITRFRPHVVHFSGHSDEELLVLEDELDPPHAGIDVPARAFARAIAATDDPPILVVLNSCNSARHLDRLVSDVVPFAIGMAESIDDSDAISYAAQFYAAIANGQSILSAHRSAQAALELAGVEDPDLPVLASAVGVDPSSTILVTPTPD